MNHAKINIMKMLSAAAISAVLWIPVKSHAKQIKLWDKEITFAGSWSRMNQNASYLQWQKGSLYRRTTILEKPCSDKHVMQICVWSGGETCSPCNTPLVNKGDVVYSSSAISKWWVKGGGSITGWSSQGIRAYIVKTTTCSSKWLSTCGGSHCQGSSAASHLPIKLRIEEYYLDAGDAFTCPEGWANTPAEWGCGGAVQAGGTTSFAETQASIQLKPIANGAHKIVAPGLKEISLHTASGRAIATIKGENGTWLFHSPRKGRLVIIITGYQQDGKLVSSSCVVR